MQVTLPPIHRLDLQEKGNSVAQLAAPSHSLDATAAPYSKDRIKGFVVTPISGGAPILVIANGAQAKGSFTHVLRLRNVAFDPASATPLDLTEGRWEHHPDLLQPFATSPSTRRLP
jgi:hypothetical protein